jgi:hypothetical protein
MWLRRLIKASRQSAHGDDLARENPSMYYLAKSLGTMGTHYNLNLKRQRQVEYGCCCCCGYSFGFGFVVALVAVVEVVVMMVLMLQLQVMLSSLFIGFTFSIRAALTAVLAVGNSTSNSYFAAKPDFNTTNDEVPFILLEACALLLVLSRCCRLENSSVTAAISRPFP